MQREQQALESNRISNWMMFLLAAACAILLLPTCTMLKPL